MHIHQKQLGLFGECLGEQIVYLFRKLHKIKKRTLSPTTIPLNVGKYRNKIPIL
jgi:hypothetical protein